jgi:hypothetical protein
LAMLPFEGRKSIAAIFNYLCVWNARRGPTNRPTTKRPIGNPVISSQELCHGQIARGRSSVLLRLVQSNKLSWFKLLGILRFHVCWK